MAPWFHKYRLDGQYSGSEKYFGLLLQFGFSNDFLVQQEIGLRSPTAKPLQLALQAEKQCGSGSFSQTCSVQSLNPQSFTVSNQNSVKLTENHVFSKTHCDEILLCPIHSTEESPQLLVLQTAEQTTDISHQAIVKVCILS
jgi:hypothetical protein